MNKIQLIKIALLIIILAEEIRNAKGRTFKKYKITNGYNAVGIPSTTTTKL